MEITKFCQYLDANGIAYESNLPLAQFTTWKIGGPADVLIRLTQSDILPEILKTATSFDVPVVYLGGGSNVLIHDDGIRGLVIKNELKGIFPTVVSETNPENNRTEQPAARLAQIDTQEYYDFSILDYSESSAEHILVDIYSGNNLAFAINNLISQGITGLQWFAGIPGTIGGAILNNIHGGSHFMSEYIETVEICTSTGAIRTLTRAELNFDYDFSELQKGKDFIIKGSFNLSLGSKEKALKTAMAWAQLKSTKQPYNTAGCCFKNLPHSDQERLNLISNSWGYINDVILHLKGQQIGGAKISEKHAAFIENTGNATSKDVLNLLNLVHDTAQAKLDGCTPKTEIFFLGFSMAEIKKFI